MKNLTVRLTDEEYQQLLKAQLEYSQSVGQQVSLNAYIKSKILPKNDQS